MCGWQWLHLELVAGDGDDPLDEVLLRLLGVSEDDDVAAARREALPEARLRPGDGRAVGELVDEDVVADLERRDHRPARDLEGLDHEGTQAERDERGHQDGFDVLADLALSPPAQADVDLPIGLHQRVDELVLHEGRPLHRCPERLEVASQLVPLLGRRDRE